MDPTRLCYVHDASLAGEGHRLTRSMLTVKLTSFLDGDFIQFGPDTIARRPVGELLATSGSVQDINNHFYLYCG